MKKDRSILIAFGLNFAFSVFELFGGIFTHSVAILSDSVHDFGDAASIGLSYLLEKKSKRDTDAGHNYGYRRYSVLGGLITTVILMIGSVIMVKESVGRLIHPVSVNSRGMLILAVIGVVLNLAAALVTRDADSINQKSVNLHMLEDVLGWIVVLIGAIIMNFTDISILDPLMSIGVAVFIFIEATKNLVAISDIFLEKTPKDIDLSELAGHILEISDVEDVHHIHVRSIDGYNHYATMHVVTHTSDLPGLKARIREELGEHRIVHAVIETENESCGDLQCHPSFASENGEHRHHHHR